MEQRPLVVWKHTVIERRHFNPIAVIDLRWDTITRPE